MTPAEHAAIVREGLTHIPNLSVRIRAEVAVASLVALAERATEERERDEVPADENSKLA